MIELFTGTPGTGKTAFVVDRLLDFVKDNPERTIYQHGINELQIPHVKVYCHSDQCDLCGRQRPLIEARKADGYKPLYVENWIEWKEENSLIIIDEVQRIWRKNITKPGEDITRLETHRHYGIDFWLISQNPGLITPSVRDLVGHHMHLVSKWNGRWQYEWFECKENPQNISGAVTRRYSLPKRVYGLYKSAEMHTKQNRKLPPQLYFLIFAVLFTLFGAYRFSKKIFNGGKESSVPVVVDSKNEHKNSVVDGIKPSDSLPIKDFPDFKPSIEGLIESAPAYRDLIKVTSAPLLAACVKYHDDCRCYTTQGSPYPSTKEYCGEVVKGNRFNPYHVEQLVQQRVQFQPPVQPSAQSPDINNLPSSDFNIN
ncbi:zonular occludens toxin domain-containing protein [Methylomonas sp. CM2]|uniref:zonular occludens toxin domain-containing protein n=1 Tax=Methylomonas sp. CM2 TaxID=3417647 RepID=UPI003CF014EA